MVTLHVRIDADGPLFRGANGILDRHLNAAVQALVEAGEQHLDELLRPRPPGVYLSVAEARRGQASTGHYRRSVHGRVSGHHGVIDDSGVVYGPWLEGVSPRNVTTRFKGYSAFRRTSQWMERQAKQIIASQVSSLVRELNT